ncbi:hypothetical protein J2Z21_007933 [Streptomyces griseochromogenes]|uniref:DUF1707 domain-containing protein n=1 Tax=Streptomyces griseochromogenes TaxID=68214 RepID=A0A1B1B4N7_9ACTN|nr:DUF1707 domain-containing protein [Streptomyces griseochromogenes]ANP53774.1 hypothetical protein AVL59_33240 [Streptomyces griseochromogenes]MBP2054921.1 hypothetical protein [Streptomyces griseochromogenes]
MSAELMRTEEPSALRASDADRDRVVDVLTAAVGDGRLTTEEHEERMAAALSARTLGDLAPLTADLPSEAAGLAPVKDVVRIEQQSSSTTRGEGWSVPRRMEIRSTWGDVTLDFSRAEIGHDSLRIDLDLAGGTLRLITRPGVVVDSDSLVIDYGTTKVRPAREPGTPVVLRVEIHGRLSMGRLDVRPSRRLFGGRAARA